MPVGFSGSLLNLPTSQKTIPVIENRVQFVRALEAPRIQALLLRHCNLFEFAELLEQTGQRSIATYVNVDQIDGIHSDSAGLKYLAEHLHIAGIVSNHPRVLAVARGFNLETIQRIFALDSTGLEAALDTVDPANVDLLDISPALVIPHLGSRLHMLPRPFIASGLIQTAEQVAAVRRAGALGIVVTKCELWP